MPEEATAAEVTADNITDVEVNVNEPAEASEEAEGSVDNWDALSNEEEPLNEDDTPELQETTAAEESDATETPEESKPAEAEAAAPEVVEEVEVEAAKVEEQTPEVKTPEKQSEQITPEQRAEFRQTWVKELSEEFTSGLSEDDIVQLSIEPEKVLPRIGAEIVAKTVDITSKMIQQAMQQQIPQMLMRHQTEQKQSSEGAEQFFTSWGELNKPEYQETLNAIGQQYRQMNPEASAEKFIEDVGKQAWVHLNLPLDGLVQKLSPQPATPVVAAPAPARTYAPAAPAGGTIPTPPAVQDEWTGLIERGLDDA